MLLYLLEILSNEWQGKKKFQCGYNLLQYLL